MCTGKAYLENINMNKTKANYSKSEVVEVVPKLDKDLVRLFSILTKKTLDPIGDFMNRVENAPLYKVLTKSSQPAHVVAMGAVIFVFYLLVPRENTAESPLWTLLYLGAFSAHFGAQIWMTFVSGLSLFLTMPRHTFGSIQKVLFPKYFFLNAVLSFITLTVFVSSHNNQLMQTDIGLQTLGLIICFLTEMVIRLYLTAPLLDLISVKTQIESEAHVGAEIGKLEPKNLLNSPRYVTIHNKFRRMHMRVAMGNILSICCTIFHLVYLSQKISLTL